MVENPDNCAPLRTLASPLPPLCLTFCNQGKTQEPVRHPRPYRLLFLPGLSNYCRKRVTVYRVGLLVTGIVDQSLRLTLGRGRRLWTQRCSSRNRMTQFRGEGTTGHSTTGTRGCRAASRLPGSRLKVSHGSPDQRATHRFPDVPLINSISTVITPTRPASDGVSAGSAYRRSRRQSTAQANSTRRPSSESADEARAESVCEGIVATSQKHSPGRRRLRRNRCAEESSPPARSIVPVGGRGLGGIGVPKLSSARSIVPVGGLGFGGMAYQSCHQPRASPGRRSWFRRNRCAKAVISQEHRPVGGRGFGESVCRRCRQSQKTTAPARRSTSLVHANRLHQRHCDHNRGQQYHQSTSLHEPSLFCGIFCEPHLIISQLVPDTSVIIGTTCRCSM